MKRTLRIRQLEALVAVASHGSMTGAASELGVSQPAVSRLLSDLSRELDFPIFDRRDGQMVPTQEVRFLMPNIRRVLDLMDQIADVSQEVTKRRAGHIRVACLPGFATSHLPGVVAEFLRDRPGVSMTIEPDRPERILEWMIGEQYDFGITDGFAGHSAIESRDIEIRTVCIFPEGHRFAALKEVSPADISNNDFFGKLLKAFREADVTLHSQIEIRQFTAACELVCQGGGISVVSELDAAKYVGRGLEFRPFTPNLPHVLSLVRPVLAQPSMVALEFIESFTASLEPYRVHRAKY